MPRARHVVDLPVRLPESGEPLRHRVGEALLALVRSGHLRPGDRLPSTRTLATTLGVGRGAVVAAYDELLAAGFVEATQGSGTRVAPGADEAVAAGAASHVEPCPSPVAPRRTVREAPPRWDLRPGRPDTTLIDPVAWRRAWRSAAESLPGNDAEAGPSHVRLRGALSDHLRRTRGVRVEQEEVLIVPGVSATLRTLPAALGLVGGRVVMEDPGYVEAATAFGEQGVEVVPVPVDADGLDPLAVEATDAQAVYVTPSHQYPLGGRMPVARRAQLLAWARSAGAVVIEDDYDGEFRYDVSPLPALRSLPEAADHVLYVGTASKVLAPTLRVAWLVPPPRLLEPLRRELESRGLVVPEAVGSAFGDFIARGALTTHHARVARTYASRRAALVAAVGRHLPDADLTGVDAGLHVVLRTPDDIDDLALVDRLAERGFAAAPLSAYCSAVDQRGLVLGYACLPETQADTAVRALAAVLGTDGA